MRLLLDTHVFLWWQADSPRLGKHARRAIIEAEAVFVSAASAWEVAVKSALGKLRLPAPFEQAVEETERLLLQAVERRLHADVPVGALLAGALLMLPGFAVRG